ncbi:MAG: hypothetical protein HYX72_00150 [Acidobacteria bacterium]|nr:hypothetical protein [Acidobacteriota bacterium]
MKTSIPLMAAALLLAVSAPAESTRYWEQSSYQSLAKGTPDGIAVSSDGTLRLGPRFDLIKETDSAYLWAIEEDAQKNVYVAAGSPARIYKVTPNGQTSVFFEAQELEIHALAMDQQGRLYAATAPDGSVYRITPDGKSSVFFDPQTKYIWDLALDSKGNLYVATGDKGQIFRVTPAGEGKIFFSSDETHVRSLILDAQDNIFAGTDGNGLILRIRPDGTPFVLYESPKKEITALALDGEGTLYVAAVGDKTVVPGQPPPTTQPPQPAPNPPQPPKNPPSVFTLNLAGGSEVYRITPDGSTQKLWSSRNDIVYSLAFGSNGNVLIGTGNDGKIYEIEPGGPYVNLTRSQSSQVTALYNAGGEVLAAASNVGSIYRLRPELASSGSFVSEIFDAGKTAQWGRLQWRQQLPANTSVRIETRSGNSSNTLLNWSPWKPARIEGNEAVPDSPRARFLQWKIVLESARGDRAPQISSIRAAYLPNNMPPAIEDVQNTPPGYRFQTINIGVLSQQAKNLTLQPIGAPPLNVPPPGRTPQSSQMTGDKGYIGVRWFAYDDNDDTLTYSVFIRGEGEKEWKLLKDEIADMFYSWNSNNWPDGTYTVKVVASDSASNPPGEALSASREGTPFEIDNTPPEIRDLKAAPDGKRIQIAFHAADRISTLQSAEYSIDGGEWRDALPVNRVTDSRELDYQFSSTEVTGGEHTVVLRVTDRFQNEAVAKAVVTVGQAASR